MLYKKINCKSYCVKNKTYFHIKTNDSDLTFTIDGGDDRKVDGREQKIEGQELSKKLYEIKECKPFVGLCVGIIKLALDRAFCINSYCDSNGKEKARVLTHKTNYIKVAVVYYRNNCKRYVPIESCELAE